MKRNRSILAGVAILLGALATPAAAYDVVFDQTWTGTVALGESIEVLSPYTLTITGTVLMSSNTEIAIHEGAKLVIDGGTVTSVGSDTWWGIFVSGDPTAPQYYALGGRQGIFEVRNGGTVENAETAAWVTGGGLVRTYDGNFINNRTGVLFEPYQWLTSSGKRIGNQSAFNTTTFATVSALPYGMQPVTHVVLDDVHKVAFRGCTFSNTAFTHPIHQRGIGIESHDSEFSVVPRCHSSTKVPSCDTWTRTRFEGLTYGIRANSLADRETLNVRYADFLGNQRGMLLSSIDDAFLIGNDIDVGPSATSHVDTASYGIRLDRSTGYTVEQNEITTTYDGLYGIIVDGSGIMPNEIYGNEIAGLTYGIITGDINSQLQIRCNLFDSITNTDLLFGGQVASTQGGCGGIESPAGNRFSHTCGIGYDIYVSPSAGTVNYYHHGSGDATPLCTAGAVSLHDCVAGWVDAACPQRYPSEPGPFGPMPQTPTLPTL